MPIILSRQVVSLISLISSLVWGKGRKEEIIWRERLSKEPSLCQIRFLDRLELQNRNKDNPDIESPDFLMAFDKNVKHTIINTLNIFYFINTIDAKCEIQ